MTTATKVLEALGFVDENGELHLDEPLDIPPSRVRVSVFVDADTTFSDGRIRTAKQAFDAYVEKAKDVDIVQEILLVGDGIETTIYTVVDTPWMDSKARRPVYDAEAEIVRAMARPVSDFQIVNLQLPRNSSMDARVGNLRSKARASWKRSDDFSG